MQRKLYQRAAAITLVALLVGCSAGGRSSQSGQQGGSDPAKAGAEVRDTVVVTLPVDVNTLDPHFIGQTQEWGILKHIDEGLVWRNEKGELKPWLAESWTNPDPLTWEFSLKKGVSFHDGTPFNAEAVKYNIDRTTDQSIKPRAQFPSAVNLDQVTVVNEHTVRLTTKSPAPTLLSELFNLPLGSPKWFKEGQLSEIARKPVGTGPYKLVEWVKDSQIVLEANPDYYGAPPAIKKIVFRPIPEISTRIAELETGKIDIATDLAPDQLDSIRQNSALELLPVETGRRIYLGFRTDKAPFDNVKVRQAVNYAIDVESISQALFEGGVKRMSSPVTPPNNDPSLQPYPYDSEKAKALLAEAGHPNGFETVLEHPVNRYIKDTEVVQAIASDLAKVGIKVRLVPMEWSAYNTKVSVQKNADAIYLLGLSSAFNSITDLYNLHPKYPFNNTQWDDPAYLAMYTELTSASTDVDRKAKAFALERYVVEQAPWAFLYRQQHFYAYRKGLQWQPRPDDYIYLYTARWTGN